MSHNGTGIPGEHKYKDYPREFFEIRKLILKRDNYTCQICQDTEEKLAVHHIDYNKQNCKENNLITLCVKCHMRTNHSRDYWYAYCMYLMEIR